MAISRDLASNNIWVESLERSLARRGRPRRASLELGKLTPARDLSDPDNVAESILYWRTRRSAASSNSIPAASGATALALLAATTLPSLIGGRSGSDKTIVRRSVARAGARSSTGAQVVRKVATRHHSFDSPLGVASSAPATAAAGTAAAGTAAKVTAKSYGEVTYGTVASVQRMLGLSADGVVGPATGAAIRQFQASHGLTVNGIVDATTFDAMQAATPAPTHASTAGGIAHAADIASSVAATAPVTETAPVTDTGAASAPAVSANSAQTPATTAIDASGTGGAAATADTPLATQPAIPNGVVALQTALHVPADGTFGSQTKAAVIAFQADHGLTPDGVVGPDTRAALDLGAGPTLKDTQPPPPPPTPAANTDATTGAPDVISSTTTDVSSSTTTASDPAPAVSTPTGPPANVAAGVAEMMQAADEIATLPYIWGGGHGSWISPGYDCSGSVSYVLHAAGLLSVPEDSSGLESYGAPGPGQYVTIYANAGHAWMTIDGRRFDTVALQEDGSRWASGGGEFDGFIVRHPVGF